MLAGQCQPGKHRCNDYDTGHKDLRKCPVQNKL